MANLPNSGDFNFRPKTHAELRAMTREHMVNVLDSLDIAAQGGLSLNDPTFWYEAIRQKDQEELSRRVVTLTWWVAAMTAVYTVATLVMLGVMLRAG